MVKLEDLKAGMRITGIPGEETVTLLSVEQKGDTAANILFRREDGKPDEVLLWRYQEDALQAQRPSRFDFSADGALFRLVSEARRIHLAHLYDPLCAVHSSRIDPLPHQISAVYDHMLRKQPLRFLLADDPGAGKTIMAGLLLRELMMRGAVSRCLICVPGNLALQWQEELKERFSLEFRIFGKEDTGLGEQALRENNQLIARMDQIKREDYHEALGQTGWDLVIIDEAHKMSARRYGRRVDASHRYRLGELLGKKAHHLLLLTATPHNGNEEDFQLFLRLLDRDRFSGDADDQGDYRDLMRRMQKESLKRYDGSDLFVPRYAYSLHYPLGPGEHALYNLVTDYVRVEFNRADRLDPTHRNSIGFALTILQRRLASSPRAIMITLRNRRERLQRILDAGYETAKLPLWDDEKLEDVDEGHAENVECEEQQSSEGMTAASTEEELRAEIRTLERLEGQAQEVHASRVDRKWDELEGLLGSRDERLRHPDGSRRKLVIFSEFLDTVKYLVSRLAEVSDDPNAIVQIDGSVPFEQRREIQQRFEQDPKVHYLVATDAAGEGINLQHAAHLMINYDLPWNPNRIEQRFGRIHRIGQRYDCRLWNLISEGTREGEVFTRLLEKLTNSRKALDGKVFDVLGDVFRAKSLRKVMISAIRDDADARQDLQNVAANIDMAREDLNRRDVLATDAFAPEQLQDLDDERARALAHRLQPWHVRAFVEAALKYAGVDLHERDSGVFAINHLTPKVRNYSDDKALQRRYPRVCFDLARTRTKSGHSAGLLWPGHPLLRALVSMLQHRESSKMQRGAVLVDESGSADETRLLLCFEQTLRDGRRDSNDDRHVLERRVAFLEIDRVDALRQSVEPPWLDYRAAEPAELAAIEELRSTWDGDAQHSAIEKAEQHVLDHIIRPWQDQEQARRLPELKRQMDIVHQRMMQEITQADQRVAQVRTRLSQATAEERGQVRGLLTQARERREALIQRRDRRMAKFRRMQQIGVDMPQIVAAALIVPAALLQPQDQEPRADARETRAMELLAMDVIMATERRLGNTPADVSEQNRGYDIESRAPSGALRFIEVKGRRSSAPDVTLTNNEILTALNSREHFILALVLVQDGSVAEPRYVRDYPFRQPSPGEVSAKFKLNKLLEHSEAPR